MSTTITGVVTNGVVVPNSPLPEGARVDIHLKADEVPNELHGVPAACVRGTAVGTSSPPDNETVERWIQERRMEKYG